MKARGMRFVASIQTLRNQATPRSRVETASKLARLEHEQARLQRERAIYEEKLLKTDDTIHSIRQQITDLRQVLYDVAEEGGGPATPRRAPRAKLRERGQASSQTVETEDDTSEGKDVHVVTLDY